MIRVDIPSWLPACGRPGYDFGRNEPRLPERGEGLAQGEEPFGHGQPT